MNLNISITFSILLITAVTSCGGGKHNENQLSPRNHPKPANFDISLTASPKQHEAVIPEMETTTTPIPTIEVAARTSVPAAPKPTTPGDDKDRGKDDASVNEWPGPEKTIPPSNRTDDLDDCSLDVSIICNGGDIEIPPANSEFVHEIPLEDLILHGAELKKEGNELRVVGLENSAYAVLPDLGFTPYAVILTYGTTPPEELYNPDERSNFIMMIDAVEPETMFVRRIWSAFFPPGGTGGREVTKNLLILIDDYLDGWSSVMLSSFHKEFVLHRVYAIENPTQESHRYSYQTIGQLMQADYPVRVNQIFCAKQFWGDTNNSEDLCSLNWDFMNDIFRRDDPDKIELIEDPEYVPPKPTPEPIPTASPTPTPSPIPVPRPTRRPPSYNPPGSGSLWPPEIFFMG